MHLYVPQHNTAPLSIVIQELCQQGENDSWRSIPCSLYLRAVNNMLARIWITCQNILCERCVWVIQAAYKSCASTAVTTALLETYFLMYVSYRLCFYILYRLKWQCVSTPLCASFKEKVSAISNQYYQFLEEISVIHMSYPPYFQYAALHME